jgi:hypothetical protein
MNESEIRKFISTASDGCWQLLGHQVISRFSDGQYVCLTSKGINLWLNEGLSSYAHDPETLVRFNQILGRS